MSTGHILDESNADYHANDAVSHSKRETFRKRPALFKRTYIDKAVTRDEADHFTFGSAFHCAILEPQKYGDLYVAQPDDIKVRRGKEWDAFKAAHDGREILRPADAALIDTLTAAVAGNPYAMDLISSAGAVCESTFRTGMTPLGFAMQCRPDVYNPQGCEFSAGIAYLADVKTVESFDRFEKQFYDFGYYRQSPFYRETIVRAAPSMPVPQRFFYIVVEKGEPHGCTVLEVDGLAMAEGSKETDQDLAALARCYQSGEWPNLPAHGYIGLPDWRVRQMDFEREGAA